MANRKVKLKNKNGDYLYPYTDNIPTASTSVSGKVMLDNTPVSGSNNAITSGAVHTALTAYQARVHSIYQAKSTVSGTAITLQDEVTIYQKSVSQNTTFTFNVGSLTKKTQVITFELYLTLSAANLTLTFPSTVSWLDATIPTTATAQKYLFAFRSFDSGQTWLGNLQGAFK